MHPRGEPLSTARHPGAMPLEDVALAAGLAFWFLLLLLLAPSWWVARFWAGDGIWGLGFIILITPFLHRVVNVIGYRRGHKREPW